MAVAVAMPAQRATQAEPVTAAVEAAAKAAASILPSSPMSMMPERSERSPAMAQRISGVESRRAAARVRRNRVRSISRLPNGKGAARHEREERLQPRSAEVGERAGEQDHQPLDHRDHVAADGGNLEGEFRPTLGEDSEQDAGEHDADGVAAAHERDGDAAEAITGVEVQQQAMVHAHDLVDAHQPGKRAGEAEGDDDDAARIDAGVGGGLLALADGAQ